MLRTTKVAVVFVASLLLVGVQVEAAEPLAPIQESSFVGHTKSVTAIGWSRDSTTLVTGADDRSIRVWDMSSGKQKSQISGIVNESYGSPVYCFPHDLKMVAASFWGNVAIRTLPEGQSIRDIDPLLDRGVKSTFRPDVFAMAFSPDGKRLATAGSKAGQGLPSGIVIIWNLDTGKPLHVFDQLETSAGTLAWSNDGTRLAAGTNGVGGELPSPGEVIVWNVSDGKQQHNFRVKAQVEYGEWASAGDVAFSPDGSQLAVPVTAGSRSNPAGLIVQDIGASIRIWDLTTGGVSDKVTELKSSVSRIQFSPDGKHIAGIGADHFARLWDSTSGQEIQSRKFDSGLASLAFDPSGKTLAVGCQNGRISLVPISERR